MNSSDEYSDRVVRRCLLSGGAFLLLLAGIVLFGRFAGIRILVTLLPAGVPMAFWTAGGFVLLGLAMVAEARQRSAAASSCSAALVLFGLGTLLLYAVAAPLGLLGFTYDPARLPAAGVRFDGRMSPNTAGCFALCGVVILLLRARQPRVGMIGSALAIVLAIALLGLLSHVTGLRSAVAWWRYTGMAVHTSLSFLVSAGVLLVWLIHRVAYVQRAITRTLPYFVVTVVALIVLFIVTIVSNEQRQAAARLEHHALQVEAAIDRFIASVARLESSTRAYALTGDEPYLARIDVHRDSVAVATEMLVQLTVDNPPQHARAIALRPLVAQKFTVNHEQVTARQRGGAEAAVKVLRGEAPELMAGLRAAVEALQREEREVLNRRRTETLLNENRLQWVLGVGAFVTIGLVGSAFALVYRAQRELEAANLGLEARIQARTDEVEAAAKRVRDSEQRLQFLADHIPQLVWTARADGIIASLNQGWRDYLGVATEAEAVRAYANAVHPDDLGATVREWERMMREGRPAGGEARLRRADGQYRWHLWRAHPERNEKGEIVRWVGTWTDIHDQKTAEAELGRRVAERTAELVASEERFRQAFELAGIGMGIVGMDGQWLRVNKSLSEFTGYAETELLGKKMLDLTYPEDAGVDRLWREELAAGQRRFYAVEKRFVHRDGRLLWVRATVSAIRDSAGTPVQFVVQVQDISAQKQLAGESISAAEPRHQSASES